MVLINGVWIRRRGGENDPNAAVEVLVELQDGWHSVMQEPLGANFSSAVGPTAMLRSSKAHLPDGAPVKSGEE